MSQTVLASNTALLEWDEEAGRFVRGLSTQPVAIDSWLVWHGRVRGYDLHWARFAGAAAERGVTDLSRFRAAVTDALPRTGLWFPRIELHTGTRPRLAVRLREAPRLKRTARLWVYHGVDPRQRPDRKGFDYPAQEALREQAREHGADEAVLLDPRGRVREGAFSTIFWWDGAEICTAADNGTVLPGITRRLILLRCADLGVSVRFQCVPPTDLRTREVWITSALHGIRTVSHWDGQPAGQVHTRRLAGFRAHLSSLMTPLPGQ